MKENKKKLSRVYWHVVQAYVHIYITAFLLSQSLQGHHTCLEIVEVLDFFLI